MPASWEAVQEEALAGNTTIVNAKSSMMMAGDFVDI